MNLLSKDIMLEQLLSNADSVFSLFTENGDYYGSIELQQPDSSMSEIGIVLLEGQRSVALVWKAFFSF